MNAWVRFYRVLLRCYPSSFQTDFSEEMEAVFTDAAAQARSLGFTKLMVFLLRELVTLPASLVSVYAWSIHAGEARVAQPADGPGFDTRGYHFTPWKDAFLGGLPHLLVGLFIGIPYFIATGGTTDPFYQRVSALAGWAAILLILGSLVLVWRRGWPGWSASWYPYWGMIFLIGILNIPVLLGNQPAALTDNWVGSVILPVLIAYLLYRITRYDRTSGLLAALPVMVACWIPMMEFVPPIPRGASWIGGWLLASLAAMGILRIHRLGSGLALSLAAAAMAGIIYAPLGVFLGGMRNFSEPGLIVLSAFYTYVPTWLFICGLALGPQLAVTLRQLGLRGFKGGLFYRLALFGLLLMIAGPLASSVISRDTHLPWMPLFTFQVYPEPIVYLGAAIYIVGFTCLTLTTWINPGKLNRAYLGLLFLSALCLPVFLSVGYPAFVTIIRLPPVLIPLVFVTGLVWCVVSAWTVVKVARVLS